MSSGFSSGGVILGGEKQAEQQQEDKKDEAQDGTQDDKWASVKRELDADRARREQEGKQENGKSLYEILQQNKAAKQEAFEESIRLKNQFRTLDDDEVEFLDSILESTRAQEAALKRETSEKLEAFHQQREEADKGLLDNADGGDGGQQDSNALDGTEQWAIPGRKRRRQKEKNGFPTLKRKKSLLSSETRPGDNKGTDDKKAGAEGKTDEKPVGNSTVQSEKASGVTVESQTKQDSPSVSGTPSKSPAQASKPLALGLAAYSSDEDND